MGRTQEVRGPADVPTPPATLSHPSLWNLRLHDSANQRHSTLAMPHRTMQRILQCKPLKKDCKIHDHLFHVTRTEKRRLRELVIDVSQTGISIDEKK